MKINLEIELLRTFIAFADTGSFKRAAELVFRSQPAVSMQMKRFEDLVGKQLFEKKGRELVLTEAGLNMVSYARQLLSMHDNIVEKVQGQKIDGKVCLGIPDDYAMLFLPNILKRFSATHPDVVLDIKSAGSNILSQRLNKGELDIAILAVRTPEEGDIVLKKDPIVWVTSKDGIAHTKRPLDLALFLDGSPIDKNTVSSLQKHKSDDDEPLEYKVVLESKSWAVLTIAALSGFAVATMAKSVVVPGLQILTEEEGFPNLGHTYIVMRATPDTQSIATSCLAERIMDDFRNDLPSTAGADFFSLMNSD
ncbi:LysR family transcriptional regulator [Pseudemcibacter aquimaris]|uniref:LysR family transcriptional regulator n=1 Tax=Pseudemcibacter aquimaris TaxID=2857064 RepID=UPI0020124A7F|nr:LysR family transcriptional regulator [Pseudemcibacter aquimaris]MCC3861203.1 LysR family transcriptional regulator [Pseudemcibacter aquimaris]WDU57978.1 LysR family transcriptional regulator [Pseudemcibacter aquimaris]